jgi:hypothetical protein
VHLRYAIGRAKPQPLSLADLARLLAEETDERIRFRLLLEFLEEYRWEAPARRRELLVEGPAAHRKPALGRPPGGLAEHLTAADGRAAPAWVTDEVLGTWWFLDDTPAGPAEALVTAPAALRRRVVFLAAAAPKPLIQASLTTAGCGRRGLDHGREHRCRQF